ncbi:MAG: hypothetical protein ACLP2P_07010 [Desulfobaccales bacterium]
MFTFGLIVEGNYDKQIIQSLIHKILLKDHNCICRVMYGNPRLLERFPRFLEEFRYKMVNKTIILKDTDLKSAEKLLQKMKDKKPNRDYPFPVKFCVAKKEIEAWLLADENAISKVAGKKIPRIKGNLEDMNDPKGKLQRILSNVNIVYTDQIAGRIALEADINIIEQRCSYFRIFRESVINH